MNEDNSLFRDTLMVGGLTTSLPLIGFMSKVNEDYGVTNKLAEFNSKLIGSSYLNDQLDRTLVSTTSSQLLSSSEQSLRKTLLSQFMAFEEASPLHILRTLQLSNFFQPLTPLSSSDDVIHISGNSIRNQQHYYESLLKYINDDENQKVKRHLKVKDLTRGFFFKNNVLYGATKTGEIDVNDVVLKNARLSLSSIKNGEIYSQNHILNKYANILGSHLDPTGSKATPLMVIGAKDNLDFSKNWLKSTLRFGMEVGFKTLDNPIAGIEEMFNMAGAEYTGIFRTKGYQRLRELSGKVGLGTNGNYDLGLRESLKISAKNIAIKGGALYLGYEGLDSVLRTISPTDGLFSQGIATGLTNIYASSRIAFAKVWSDRFQGYKEKQEQSAPGSTNLSTLLAFPLGGALLGAQMSYFSRIGKTMMDGSEAAANVFNVESESKFLKNTFNFDTKLKPMKKNAILGGLIGGAFSLPFLPGALIGTSSEELEQLYSGEKEIKEKSTKGWLFCLPPTQEVYTESGLKKAVEITLQDRLMDRSGAYKEVIRLFKRPVDEKIYNITVSGSKHIENKMTGNHPILTINGWVNAEDVRINDIVIAPKPKILENYSLDLKDILHSVELEGEFLHNTCQRQDRIIRSKGYTKRFLQLTPELGKIFGWFLAEGCISKGLLEFTFDISEIDFATDCAEYLKNIFNINYTIVKISGKAYRLRISSVSLTKIFKLFFYNSFNDTFKKFPNLTITNKEFIRNFLIGLYYGDGDISKTKEDRIKNNGSRSRIRLTTSKLDHVLGIKNYLTLWDIYPCVLKETALSKFPDGTSGIYTSYRICCEGINSFRLANEVGIKKELYNYTKRTEPQTSKLKNYWFDEDYLYIKITNITSEDYKGFVYDFEVKDSHEFQLTSFIVHNSGGAWDGGSTKFHTKSWVARMRADATDKVRYGDDETKKAMNPFLHPLSYLKDPYKFEKRNAEAMPYPVWGMDVSYGSFFGKVFERTIGQVIKPDIINPAYKDAIEQGTAYTPVESTESSSKTSLTQIGSGLLGGKKTLSNAFIETSESLFGSRSNQKLQGISNKDSSLIVEGLMEKPQTPSYNPDKEALSLTYRSLMDFTGIKGWSSSLVIEGLGLEPSVNSIQLARSGEASSSARDLLEQNLGDLMGCFTPEMKVKTINGEKEIQDIEVGDLVLSKGGVYRPVKQVFKKEFKDIYILEVITDFNRKIKCTPDHVFPGLKRKETELKNKEIQDYNVGDFLINTFSSTLEEIIKINIIPHSGYMYDLEIDGNEGDSIVDINYYTIESILCHNSGEFQRKILPTSSGALPERFNPITNNAASWLPSDASKYYIDFKHGNQYDAVERGEERLPGVGFESLYPELKGINVEDYPLVFKHKILSNVAKGSEEFINMRKQAIDAYQQGKLSTREIDILGTTLDQELERDRKKEFYQEPNKLRGPVGTLHNTLWESMRANSESPLEMLLPIRPVAKFLHQRTAIEDYIETQLGGPDTAIWTNPYSHFIKPALNKLRQSSDVTGTFIPEETKEKYNIDEYFDKFKYLKARREKSDFQSESTVIGSTLSGLNTKDKVLKFKRSLQDEQKPYFDEFSKETNEKKRDKIRAIIPQDVRRGYEQIWQNLDLAVKAKKDGKNVQEVLAENLSENTNRLKKAYNVSLDIEDKEKARNKVKNNKDNYVNQGISENKRIQYTEDELLRKKMADRESLTYLNNRTGVPSSKFIGWDPRLSSDDIKIRTLSIGNQDLKRFGFWKKDEERMNTLSSIVNTNKVFKDIDKIKEDIRSDRRLKRDIEKVMFEKGYKTNKIDLVDSNFSSILIENNEN